MKNSKIAIFQKKEIRKTIYKNEWWFVINDIISALTDSKDPAQYFKRMKLRDEELKKLTEKGGVQFVPPLRIDIETIGGKQKMYCWHTEGIFRIIQSIPSPKAEPFKHWLAKVGYERVQEIEDPELATKRTRAIYKAKGYSDDWIHPIRYFIKKVLHSQIQLSNGVKKRMRGIAIREELTDSHRWMFTIPRGKWKNRIAKEQKEYAILTVENNCRYVASYVSTTTVVFYAWRERAINKIQNPQSQNKIEK